MWADRIAGQCVFVMRERTLYEHSPQQNNVNAGYAELVIESHA